MSERDDLKQDLERDVERLNRIQSTGSAPTYFQGGSGVSDLRKRLDAIERELVNVQPHIAQACPGSSTFIDAHIDAALRIVRALLALPDDGAALREALVAAAQRILEEIAGGRLGSIGSLHNVYCAHIPVERVAALSAALAGAKEAKT